MGRNYKIKGHWGPGAVWIPDPEPYLETEPEEEAAEEQPQSEWEQYRTHGPNGRPIIVTGDAVRGSFQMWRTQGEGIINPASVQRVEQDPLLHRGEIRPQYLDMAATWNPPPADRWTPEYQQNPPPLHQLAWEYNRRVNQSLTPSTWHEQTGRQMRSTGGGVRGDHGPSILRTMYQALGPFTPEERAEAERRLREEIENIEYGPVTPEPLPMPNIELLRMTNAGPETVEAVRQRMAEAATVVPVEGIPPTEDEINQIAERVGEAISNAIPYSTATDVIPATEEELNRSVDAYRNSLQQYLRERLSESLGEEVDTETLRSLMSDALENIREQLSSRSFVEHFMTEVNIEEEEQRLRADLTAHQHPSGSGVQPAGVAVAEGDEPAVPVPDQGEEG